MRHVIVNLQERSYPIYIQNNLLEEAGSFCEKHNVSRKVVLFTDDTVQKLYAAKVKAKLKEAAYQIVEISIAPGEQSKSLAKADLIYEKLINEQIDRQATIIALGGGVVGDLAGFVAATYKRGISYIQLPTTLLAQTDSSVGGKVGINHRLGKNLIGSFYQPKFVLIDPLVLKTLDKRDVISGLGEVIKYGLIDDADLFEKVKQQYGDLVEINDLKAYEEIVERCCSIKAKIVSQDEKESGRRAILNFGHTIAHALEAVTDFCYFQHGEAVILGMMSMCWLSAELNLITKEKFERVFNFLETALTINFPRHLSADKILKFVYFDKKVCGDRLNVILLKEVGHAIIKKEIEEKLMLKAITFLLNYFERK